MVNFSFFVGRRDRATNLSASAAGRLHNFLGRRVNQAMVKGLQPDSDTLVLHDYLSLKQPVTAEGPRKKRAKSTEEAKGCQQQTGLIKGLSAGWDFSHYCMPRPSGTSQDRPSVRPLLP